MGIAIVTGTSGQLGPIWCETLNDMGYGVHEVDLPRLDVSDLQAMWEDAEDCVANYGVPEVVIANAAIDNPPGSQAKFHGNLERILNVNLVGACNTVQPYLPHMMREGRGTIIFIGSIMGFIGADWRNYPEGFEKPVAYGLSKAALMQYARSLTVQYGRYGIRACCIAFGPYDGGKLDPVFLGKFLKNVPLGRPISLQSVKAALRFAIECPEFAGQTMLIDAGYTAW